MKNHLSFVCGVLSAAWSIYAQPANDLCANATPVTGFITIPYNTTGSTTDGLPHDRCNQFPGTAQINQDVWYCWTAHQTGPVLARTCGLTGMDTKIAVYNGCECPEGSGIIWCSDDRCQLQSQAFFYGVAGRSYLVRLGVKGLTETGTGSLEFRSATVNGPVVNPANGHTFYLVQGRTWLESEDFAVVMGGHLATVRSEAENAWIVANVLTFGGNTRTGWTGLNDRAVQGTFVWTSGEPVQYLNWAPGQPATGQALDHVAINPDGTWQTYVNGPSVPIVYGIVELPPSCYANCDNSTSAPLLTANDFLCFVNLFAANQPYANCDGSTVVPVFTANDFQCFINAYAAGCF